MTSDIIEMIRERDRFLYIFKKSKLPEDHRKFCELRNKVQRQVKTAKSEYFSNQIEQDRDNPKKIMEPLKGYWFKGQTKGR